MSREGPFFSPKMVEAGEGRNTKRWTDGDKRDIKCHGAYKRVGCRLNYKAIQVGILKYKTLKPHNLIVLKRSL